jgi:hypothetical protein
LSRLYVGLLVFVAALSAIVALMPLITGLKQVLPPNPTPKETLDTLITVLGVLMTLTTVVFGAGVAMSLAKSDANDARVENLLSEIRQKLGLNSVKHLQDYEFYPHFLQHCESAERAVDICYFEAAPPGEPSRDVKIDYYRKHFELARQSRKVAYRRIFRDSPANKVWIGQLLNQELLNVGNVEVAVLKERGSGEMPLALSIQVVDAKKVWFVAIATHRRGREPRDLYIESAEVAAMMEKYYDRLWARSLVVFRGGQITEDGREYLDGESGGAG